MGTDAGGGAGTAGGSAGARDRTLREGARGPRSEAGRSLALQAGAPS